MRRRANADPHLTGAIYGVLAVLLVQSLCAVNVVHQKPLRTRRRNSDTV